MSQKLWFLYDLLPGDTTIPLGEAITSEVDWKSVILRIKMLLGATPERRVWIMPADVGGNPNKEKRMDAVNLLDQSFALLQDLFPEDPKERRERIHLPNIQLRKTEIGRQEKHWVPETTEVGS